MSLREALGRAAAPAPTPSPAAAAPGEVEVFVYAVILKSGQVLQRESELEAVKLRNVWQSARKADDVLDWHGGSGTEARSIVDIAPVLDVDDPAPAAASEDTAPAAGPSEPPATPATPGAGS